MSGTAVYAIDGDPLAGTYNIPGTDGYRTLQEMGVSVKENGVPPQGIFITVETNAARFLYSGAGGTGHTIATGGSISIKGAAAVQKLRMGNASAGSNFVAQITPYF